MPIILLIRIECVATNTVLAQKHLLYISVGSKKRPLECFMAPYLQNGFRYITSNARIYSAGILRGFSCYFLLAKDFLEIIKCFCPSCNGEIIQNYCCEYLILPQILGKKINRRYRIILVHTFIVAMMHILLTIL
jgi:hypothetical protein